MMLNAKSATGQRMVFHGCTAPKPLITETAELPEIKDGEILGKMLSATICGSDLHTIHGQRIEPSPSVLGHEGVFEVMKHKSANNNVKIGDRLTFSIADSCLKCDRCEDGIEQKCTALFKYGHAVMNNGTGWNGCYATHIVIRKGTHVVKVPENIPNNLAAPINCALSTMVNALSSLVNFDNMEGKWIENKHKSVLVQGAGLLGIYGCAILKEAGYGKVYVYDIIAERLDQAEKFGAIPINGAKNEQQLLKDSSISAVVEVAGAKRLIKEGIRVLKPGGRYVLVGLVHPNSHLDITAEQIIRKCLTIEGIHNYRPIHLDQAVDFLSRTMDKFPYKEIVSPLSFNLQKMDEAIDLSITRKYLRVTVNLEQAK